MNDIEIADDRAGVEEVAAKALNGRRAATFSDLRRKPRRTMVFTINTVDEDGEDLALELKYQALSAKEYDELVAAHPPKPKDRDKGFAFDVDSFAPALIAAVALSPRLSIEQATDLYTSPEWSGGEVTTLYLNAQRICNAGLDVPFSERG